jgi:hypothetical protein
MLLLFFSFLGVSGSIYTAKVSTKACAFLDFLVGAYLCPLSCCLLARVEINEQLSRRRRRRRRRRKWREREAACTCNKRRPYLDTQLAAQWTDMKHEHAPTHNGCGYLNECLPMLVEPSEPTQGLQSFPKTLPLEPARIRRGARNGRSSSLAAAGCSKWLLELTPEPHGRSTWLLEPAPETQDARNGCSSLPRSHRGARKGRSSVPWSRRGAKGARALAMRGFRNLRSKWPLEECRLLVVFSRHQLLLGSTLASCMDMHGSALAY